MDKFDMRNTYRIIKGLLPGFIEGIAEFVRGQGSQPKEFNIHGIDSQDAQASSI